MGQEQHGVCASKALPSSPSVSALLLPSMIVVGSVRSMGCPQPLVASRMCTVTATRYIVVNTAVTCAEMTATPREKVMTLTCRNREESGLAPKFSAGSRV